ncbi:hypothetical protein L1987_75595 [Smallanthus sonchifolius]|uniref:Uncharacterized protein n=1 Tax=Smallanthus sonchifolius TaxID=185202 RepID=A0ACB9A559_9ASTR|nr:hypothetical protein L1987_75595 [Smallanthus sonchifolius]
MVIWKAGFHYGDRVVGFIKDYLRVFHQGSTDHRGTPEYTGRIVTLEPAEGEVKGKWQGNRHSNANDNNNNVRLEQLKHQFSRRSDKKMEKDEGLRTVECLRGRLLAERATSKAANDESEQISKKVTELEKQLKMEIKSRNKAEKRLKFLMKKLDSLNISYSYVSADESSSISEKSEISSVSSSKSQYQMELMQKPQLNNISKCVTDIDTCDKRHNCPSREHDLGSLDEAISENVIQSGPKDGGEDDNGSKYYTAKNNNYNEEHNQDTYHNVDNSMALVVVEKNVTITPRNDEDQEDIFDTSMALVVVDSSMVKEENQDVSISNGNVKDVLDALRFARESLQTSMDMRRHMESNIAQARLDRISC